MTAKDNSAALPSDAAEFDGYAASYDQVLNQALSVSGNDKLFFAERRIAWLRQLFARMDFTPQRVLDFGCGTGTSIPFLCDLLGARDVVGVDLSGASLDVARRSHGDRPTTFSFPADYTPAGELDLAFCNGVFHHIPPHERQDAAEYVSQSLRPGGIFAFWENNPWNPGARYCMRVNPFDRDAIPLSPFEARSRLRTVGFHVLVTNYLFVFPQLFASFRWLEHYARNLPIGAQYLVLCQKPLHPRPTDASTNHAVRNAKTVISKPESISTHRAP